MPLRLKKFQFSLDSVAGASVNSPSIATSNGTDFFYGFIEVEVVGVKSGDVGECIMFKMMGNYVTEDAVNMETPVYQIFEPDSQGTYQALTHQIRLSGTDDVILELGGFGTDTINYICDVTVYESF